MVKAPNIRPGRTCSAFWFMYYNSLTLTLRYREPPLTKPNCWKESPSTPVFLSVSQSCAVVAWAVEHILAMLAAGDSAKAILSGYSWLEAEEIQACLLYERKLVGQESFDFLTIESVN